MDGGAHVGELRARGWRDRECEGDPPCTDSEGDGGEPSRTAPVLPHGAVSDVSDARVVEVSIRLKEGHRVTGLINARVDVIIFP